MLDPLLKRLVELEPAISRIRGAAHSSLIGTVTLAWLGLHDQNVVQDEAPTVRIDGKDRKPDLVLGNRDGFSGVVEIENNPACWTIDCRKVERALSGDAHENARYYKDIDFGLLGFNAVALPADWERQVQDLAQRADSRRINREQCQIGVLTIRFRAGRQGADNRITGIAAHVASANGVTPVSV